VSARPHPTAPVAPPSALCPTCRQAGRTIGRWLLALALTLAVLAGALALADWLVTVTGRPEAQAVVPVIAVLWLIVGRAYERRAVTR
jgi:hypothetical protein